MAADLGIATSCLRRWMKQDDIHGGRREGLSSDERAELVRLRRELRTAHMERPYGERDPAPCRRLLRQGDAAGPKMTYTFIARACADLPVAACCRVMRVSTSGFYSRLANPVREKDHDDAYLSNTIVDIWTMSRRSYGSPRVHAELRLGQDLRCSHKRVERLMRQAGIAGIHQRRRRGCTKRDFGAEPSDDLVKRAFDPTEPDRMWVLDVERACPLDPDFPDAASTASYIAHR